MKIYTHLKIVINKNNHKILNCFFTNNGGQDTEGQQENYISVYDDSIDKENRIILRLFVKKTI